MAFVVHEEAEIILSESCKAESFTPKTILLISPFEGAVNITLDAPHDRC